MAGPAVCGRLWLSVRERRIGRGWRRLKAGRVLGWCWWTARADALAVVRDPCPPDEGREVEDHA